MSKAKIKIVLGSLFGDEGKGNTVQYLCKQALAEGRKPVVIRFCGGPQAGHRIVHNGVSHIASTFGSGSLLGVPTYYVGFWNNFIDPISLQMEKEVLESKGVNPQIFIAGNPNIITPYDVVAGRMDEKVKNDGTCGKGIYATYRRHECQITRTPLQLETIAKFWGLERNLELEEKFTECFRKMPWASRDTLSSYDTYIFEGTQGLLLDKDFGFMPHCTPSNVGLKGIYPTFLDEDTEVYLVTRTYLTRHGNGYEPVLENHVTPHLDISHEPTNLDTGYQGKFKKGIFEVPLLLRAFDRHTLDNYSVHYKLVMTHCDCIKNELIPYIGANGYEELSGLNMLVNDITTNSCIKFDNVLLFNNEEM